MSFANNPQLQGGESPESALGRLNHFHTGTGTSAWLSGELVKLSAATPPVATVLGTAGALTATPVAGQAQKADGATAVVQPFIEINPNQKWKIKCTNNGTAAFAGSFRVGTNYGLYLASNVWYADLNVTNQDMVVFLGPALGHGEAADGSESSWGWFSFIPSVCHLSAGI